MLRQGLATRHLCLSGAFPLSVAAVVSLSCAAIPENRFTLDRISFEGNETVSSSDLKEKIASSESPRFLGMFRGVVYDYEIFDRYVLERDLERIQRYYRARGYYKARVRAGRVILTAQRHTRVEILISEGPPVRIDRVDFHGLEGLPPQVAFDAGLAVRQHMDVGEPFEEEKFEKAEGALKRALTDHGYVYAGVRRSAEVDLPRDLAAVGYWLEPGRPAHYGPIAIEGLGDIPRAPVERALDIKPGTPFSTSELESAERAVLELGMFSSVKILPNLSEEELAAQPERVPLRVVLTPTRPRSVYFGGGIQIDSIKTDLHLRAGWEHSNFFGGLRRFQVEIVPGVVFWPTRIPDFEPVDRLLPLFRLRTEFRQPGVFEARTNFLARAQLDVYPVLFAEQEQDAGEDIPILGYRETRGSVGLDRTIWRAYSALSLNLQQNSPFAYVGPLDPDLGPILITYPEISLTIDLRDQKIHPEKGLFTQATLQVGAIGDAQDVKVQPEIRSYVPLGMKRLVLAARAGIGLLFPFDYSQTLISNVETGLPPPGTSRAAWVHDVQVTFLRGLFAGGPSSNRGYALREIGPHGVVPFYNPGQTSTEIATSCAPGSPQFSDASCDLPLGGLTLWEASLELRYPISGPLLGAVFADTADVSPERVDFRLNRPHLSIGLGFRYDTPVGPIRLDMGYRVPGLQAGDAPDEGVPVETFGLPIALSFGIGEAF